MKKIILLLISILATNGFCQENSVAITSKLDSIYKKSNFPGFAVSVVNENGVVYQNAFGYSEIKNKQSFTINSVQNIGSISKTFIGVALMKSIELGYFNLETEINSILPYTVDNPNIETDTIRIKHLASHTSGILDDEEVYEKSFLENKYSDKKSKLYKAFIKRNVIINRTDSDLATFLKNYFNVNGKWYKKTNFNTEKVGTKYNYSNIGAALAAHLIEIKSGISFEDFCKKYIFKPLKLGETSFFINDSVFKNHAKIYNTKKQFYPLYSAITYPDGSLRTSCYNLSIYLKEMIKGYNGNSKLLSKQSFEILFKKQFEDNNLPLDFDKKEPNSGIFWRIKKNGMIGHTGSDLGISTFMFFDPKTKTGKIFMTNIEFDNPNNDSIDEKLVNQFIEIWKILDEL